jgi:DNA-binding FadR family transcriptional regulator
MVSDASAVSRAYAAIKALIISGALPVRSRIDVEKLARELGISSMPVRQALTVLMWQRLVRPGQHAAYMVALWSAAELAELYAWRATLLTLTLPGAAAGSELMRIARTELYPQAFVRVMRLLESNANAELRLCAIDADERLQVARAAEMHVLGDVAAEFEHLVGAIAERSRRAPALAKAFHRRRAIRASALRDAVVLGALPNNGGNG